MEPCISEYGVMGMDDQRGSLFASPIDSGALDIFKEDVYGFGVILLELLTVVKEEWTGEVFDKSLISEYASDERMVNLHVLSHFLLTLLPLLFHYSHCTTILVYGSSEWKNPTVHIGDSITNITLCFACVVCASRVETNKAVPRDDQQTMNRQTGSIHGLDAPKRFLLERPRGFGFITYDSEEVADRVLKGKYRESKISQMMRRTLVSFAKNPEKGNVARIYMLEPEI
ncbi:hypothetical protein JHK86_033791 [Glycine max]|nr:hypothetical protein JHK86_033791 [Glycine max]